MPSVYEHWCSGCQLCPSCSRVAWCEEDPILVIPCEHKGYCGDCCLSECAECQQEAEADIQRGLDAAVSTVAALIPVTPETEDPWAALAAESRAETDRFWANVGDRSHLLPKDAS